MTRELRRWTALAAALIGLNLTLTFHNVWPTIGIHWVGELSIDIAVLILLMSLWRAFVGPLSPKLLMALAAIGVVLTLARYAEVSAPVLYGRPVNLYWDVRHVPAVAAMLARAASVEMLWLGGAAFAAVIAIAYVAIRWSLECIASALDSRAARRGLGGAALALIAVFTLQRLDDRVPRVPQFSLPISATFGRQLALMADAVTRGKLSGRLPASPRLESDLGRLHGADVLVIFVESYGAVTFDDPELAARLEPARARLAQTIAASGREVVSAFVESPTFGGSSWLAHINLMSGIEVRDEQTYRLLMTQRRETLGTTFARHGYRSVAVMPGLRQSWPEGAFFRFDRIYDAKGIDYRGPEFGWWRIPDQYSLGKLDALELRAGHRSPVFAMFPTINTHMPFQPVPPYQPDWQQLLSARPYTTAGQSDAFSQPPQRARLAGAYAASVEYALDVIGGYLQSRASQSSVVIMLGDHQPPGGVAGPGSRWDVPVHVIASQRDILDELRHRGFTTGLTPAGGSLCRMNELAPLLLDSFARESGLPESLRAGGTGAHRDETPRS